MGLQNPSLTKKAEFDKESLQNNIIPDPTMIKRLRQRQMKFDSDMMNMTHRTISFPGDTWGSSFGQRS